MYDFTLSAEIANRFTIIGNYMLVKLEHNLISICLTMADKM